MSLARRFRSSDAVRDDLLTAGFAKGATKYRGAPPRSEANCRQPFSLTSRNQSGQPEFLSDNPYAKANAMTRSVAEIRRESERTRDQLSQTVNELRTKITDTAEDIRYKVSPTGIKSEVSSYLSEKSRGWIDGLKQQAMDNPMQALASGVAIAVPALKIARSIPLPLLLVGAGFALSSSRVRNALGVNPSADGLRDAADNVMHRAQDLSRSASEAVQGAASDAKQSFDERTDHIREAAADIVGQVQEGATNFGQEAAERVASGLESAKSTIRDAKSTIKDTVSTAEQKLATFATRSKDTAQGAVGDHAVLVGGLGLAIGALIAASLPSTRVEGNTLGVARSRAQEAASDAIDAGFAQAKDAVMGLSEDVAGKFADANLGSQATRMTNDAAEKLKKVADDAITTAFEPSHSNQR